MSIQHEPATTTTQKNDQFYKKNPKKKTNATNDLQLHRLHALIRLSAISLVFAINSKSKVRERLRKRFLQQICKNNRKIKSLLINKQPTSC
jgi:hypothetical protein